VIPPLSENLTPLDVLCLIIAAAAHDVRHPGVTNQFLIDTESELALTYNDTAVLESYHCAETFALLRREEMNIFENFTLAQRREARECIVAAILGTDMKAHVRQISEFRTSLDSHLTNKTWFDPGNKASRLLTVQVALHAADVANPAKPLPLCRAWADRIVAEWYAQGDAERCLGLPVTGMMDRTAPVKAKSQKGFIDFFVAPLFALLEEAAPAAKIASRHIELNRAYWQGEEEEEAAAKARAAAAAAKRAAAPNDI